MPHKVESGFGRAITSEDRNNITEDLEDSSAEWRDREGPKGSNASSRLERQNVSILSLMDVTPPPVFAEIHAMKEQMEVMMNALKGQVSSDLDDLVNRIDSLFTAVVNFSPLPHKFRMPHIDSYDGVKDPLDHLDLQDIDTPSRCSR